MAVPSDGASSSGSDPVLSGALSEMSSEGAFSDSSDPGTSASQPSGSESAVPSGAQPQATGDAGTSPTGPAPTGASAAATDPLAPSPAAADPATDPFAGTEPFTFGDGKTLDGVFRVPGEGLLVPEDKVHVVTALAERADSLDRAWQESAQRNDVYERLSAWHTTDAQGNETVVNGLEGLMTMRVQMGTLAAAYDTLASVFTDPAQFAALVTVNPEGQIVPNKAELANLLTRSDLAESRATQAIREHLSKIATVAPPAQDAAPDYAKVAPQLITQAAKTAGVDAKTLTDKDTAFLAQQFPRYIRTVTEQDRRGNPALKVGGPIVDETFTQLVKDRVEMRLEQKKSSEAAEKAGKFNAGQDKGRQPVAAPKPPTPPAKPGEQAKVSRSDAWASPLNQALEEMSIPIR